MTEFEYIPQEIKSLIADHLQSGRGIITISTEDLAGIFKNARKVGTRSETVDIAKADQRLAEIIHSLLRNQHSFTLRHVILQIEMSTSHPLNAGEINDIITSFSQQLDTDTTSFTWGASQRAEVPENQVCLTLILVSL